MEVKMTRSDELIVGERHGCQTSEDVQANTGYAIYSVTIEAVPINAMAQENENGL